MNIEIEITDKSYRRCDLDKESIDRKNRNKRMIYLTLLIVAIVILAVLSKLSLFDFCQGVIISIIASLIVFIYTTVVDDSLPQIKTDINSINNSIATLSSVEQTKFQGIDNDIKSFSQDLQTNTKIIEKQSDLLQRVVNSNAETTTLRDKYGIIQIVKREEYSYEFWRALLKKARAEENNQLILTGRTLGRWMISKIREDFINTLKALAKDKKKIKFVIYKHLPEGSKEIKEKEDLHKMLMENVFPIIKEAHSSYEEAIADFEIIEVDSMPYLFNSIKDEIIVSQYFEFAGNEDGLMFVLDSESPFAVRYVTDLDKLLAARGEVNPWLKEYYG